MLLPSANNSTSFLRRRRRPPPLIGKFKLMEATSIKLFGKSIAWPGSRNISDSSTAISTEESSDCGHNEHGGCDHGHGLRTEGNACLEEERTNRKHSDKAQLREEKREDESSPKEVTESDGSPKNPITIDMDAENTETQDDNLQPTDLKKPGKIAPCPRCNSMDTKFCYYNNYNVRQPRHFCKSCQRYWTAGGTMRTMLVGAGRRKIKNPTSQCHFVTISQAAQIEFGAASNGVHSVPPKVLPFSLDFPCVDGASVSAVSCRDRESGDDCSTGSTVTTSSSVTEKMQEKNGFDPHGPCIPGVSWSYNPWNLAIPIPGVFPAPMSMPIYTSPYWNYIPWLPLSPPAQNQKVQPSSDLNSFILGKHSRDKEMINPNGLEEPKKPKNSVLIPKTLRFDDPDEAAMSSIWSTLGIKNEREGLFKAFQTKGEESKRPLASTTVLHANPAALSRSRCFQERA